MSRDRFAINHELKSHGFASLDEAGALAAQLAYLVQDDKHFASLLNACEPEERRNMYEAMAPNLPFKARSLAEYLIEMAEDAERRQLPVIGEDGQLRAFKPPVIESAPKTDAAIATEAVAEALAKERLWVVCVLCTREDVFRGATKDDAVADARKNGWRVGYKRSSPEAAPEQVEVCPACVKARAPRMVAA
jgi:hypothetical protein